MTNYLPNSSELFTTVHFLEIYIVRRNNNLYENSLEGPNIFYMTNMYGPLIYLF